MENSDQYKVYGFVRYDRIGKVLWTLEELGLSYKFIELDHDKKENETPEHLKLHPMGAVPVLQVGDLTIHESNAICTFLAEKFPNSGLLPSLGTSHRAHCFQWMWFMEATRGAISAYREALNDFPKVHDMTLTADGKNLLAELKKLRTECSEQMAWANRALEKELSDGREYLLGHFTLADIIVSYSMAWSARFDMLKDYPNLLAYVDRNVKRPAAEKSGVFKVKS